VSGFILFIAVYLSIYGGVHVYGFIKAKQGLSLEFWGCLLLAIFMTLMVAAPIMVRWAEKYVDDRITTVLAVIAFTWMGLLFIFISTAFAFDVYRGLLFICRFIFQKYFLGFTPTAGFSFAISLIVSCVAMAYGFYEANTIRLEHVAIQTDKLPDAQDNLRIVQISDVHLGVLVGEKRLQKILEKVKAAKPHLMVSTGDLVDGEIRHAEKLAAMLHEIDTPHGKYAVTGNHEFYAGLADALDFTKKAGFKVLQGASLTLPNLIHIAGVDDPARRRRQASASISETTLLSKLSDDLFVLLLKHQPVIANPVAGHFDLQLSGHTHCGQIFPFRLLTRLFYDIHPGLTRLSNGSFAYVSRGSGTWGPPVRFLAPPEVTLIELVKTSVPNLLRH